MYFPIDTNSYAKEKSIRVFIFSSCFSFQVFFFEVRSYKLQLFENLKNFTTTKYIWCQMLKSQINCNNITVTVISWLVRLDMK